MANVDRIPFLGVAFDNARLSDVFADIDAKIRECDYGYMVSVNVDIVGRANNDPYFKESLMGADLILMDSEPLSKLAERLGLEPKEKLSGSDLMPEVCAHAAEKGYSVYFLGGAKGVPEQAAEHLLKRFPGLIVAGSLSPEYGFDANPEGIAEVVAEIEASKPDIVFVCLGAPLREAMAHELLELTGTHYALCVGAAIDFAAGSKRRAPEWMQDAGLEWLHRFSCEPRRLFRRYFIESWRIAPLVAGALANGPAGNEQDRKMRVAVDLTSLADNFSGIERYAAGVALALVEDGRFDLTLVFKGEVHPLFLDAVVQQSADVVVIPRGRMSKLAFSQLVLPVEMARTSADLALFLAFPAPFLLPMRSVSTVHDMTFADFPETMTSKSRAFFRVMDFRAVRFSRSVITISEFSKERIVDYYRIQPDRVHVAYCGVDSGRFNRENACEQRRNDVIEKYGLPEKFILSLSTIEPRKNLSTLIRAWADLRVSGLIECDLVLAGRMGWKSGRLLDECPDDMRKHVRFTGFVEDEDLPALYAASELFVFPSLYEGFGLPPVEAVCSGANVLCSNIPCLKEVCGTAVGYFSVQDEASLKNSIQECLKKHAKSDAIKKMPRSYKWHESLSDVESALRF